MRGKLIANPLAGHKGGIATNRATVADVLAALAGQGLSVDVDETARPGHATELARAAARDGYDVVIAAGGDGTVRETAIGLLGSQVPLGIMPLGSVMNVARMLGIPRDIGDAAAIVAAGRYTAIDVGRAGDTYFLEAAGVGIDAALFRYGNEIDRGRWDRLGAMIALAIRYRPQAVVLELDGWTVELAAMMVTVANGPYCGAALQFAPEARVDDRRFDVRVFGPMSKLSLLRTLWRPGNATEESRVYTFKARDVRIAAPRPLPVHADAESIGTTPVRFSLLPGALLVCTGDIGTSCAAPSRQPAQAPLP